MQSGFSYPLGSVQKKLNNRQEWPRSYYYKGNRFFEEVFCTGKEFKFSKIVNEDYYNYLSVYNSVK